MVSLYVYYCVHATINSVVVFVSRGIDGCMNTYTQHIGDRLVRLLLRRSVFEGLGTRLVIGTY